ncbi:MAG TPA: hypothetical protein VLG50_00690 [Candidatus Saccharimonadales bacterium]|nr:hypothetical protein [Candidatus Saccharimonadales bacterium]
MKKTVFFLLSIVPIPQFITTHYENHMKHFSGSIEFPVQMEYDLCLFYKGQKLEIEQNKTSNIVQFSFIDSKETQTVYLIIAPTLSCLTEQANTVHHLQLPNDCQYICYKLQAQREISDENYQLLTWKIEDHELENRIIPQNSLIFLFDPNLIAGLKVQSWKPENVFRIIPTLVVNPKATACSIGRAMMTARLAALDIDVIHAKPHLYNKSHA